jgi:AcrR family transcriptional regulator
MYCKYILCYSWNMDTIKTGEAGRPRDEKTRALILKTTLGLVADDGYAELNIKRIADISKVSRQTIYRWWSTKGEILLEAVREQTTNQELRTSSLEFFLQDTFALGQGIVGEAMVGIMADAQRDNRLHQQLQQYIGERRAILRNVLGGLTVNNGSFVVPVEVVVDMLFGAMWYRLLDRHALLSDTFAFELTKATIALLV